MMARSHAMSAIAAWTAPAATAAMLGHPFPIGPVLIGTAVVAGSAILPDIDHPDSHAARSFGALSRTLSRGVAALSGWCYRRTATALDPVDRREGHRGVTHTIPFAAAAGLVVTALAFTPAGKWVTALVLFVTATWAVRALVPWDARRVRVGFGPRRKRPRVEWAMPVAAVTTWSLITFTPDPRSWAWLGLPVFLGALVHDLGDAPAHHPGFPPETAGIPLLWPLKIRGRRWYRVRPPVVVMFPVDSTLEHCWAFAFTVVTIASGALLRGAW